MILGVLSSSSEDSYTRLGLRAVADLVREHGESFDLLDLSQEYHRLQDLTEYDCPPPRSQTAALRRRFARADAVVLATPVYHGTYSGLLKNALDQLLGSALAGRPVGLMANGGGARGAAVACDQLRSVVRALSGWAAPTQVSTSMADFVDGRPVEVIHERLRDMVAQLVEFNAGHQQRRLLLEDRSALPAGPLVLSTTLQTQGS